MFERYYFFFCYCLLSFRYMMFQKRVLSKPKRGRAQAVVKVARPPGLPVATALNTLLLSNSKQKATQNLSFLMYASCLFVNHFLLLVFCVFAYCHFKASFCRPLAACRPCRRARIVNWLLRYSHDA